MECQPLWMNRSHLVPQNTGMGAPLEFITSDYEPCIPDSSSTVDSVLGD